MGGDRDRPGCGNPCIAAGSVIVDPEEPDGGLQLLRLRRQFLRGRRHLFRSRRILLRHLVKLLDRLIDLIRPDILFATGGFALDLASDGDTADSDFVKY